MKIHFLQGLFIFVNSCLTRSRKDALDCLGIIRRTLKKVKRWSGGELSKKSKKNSGLLLKIPFLRYNFIGLA